MNVQQRPLSVQNQIDSCLQLIEDGHIEQAGKDFAINITCKKVGIRYNLKLVVEFPNRPPVTLVGISEIEESLVSVTLE
jgi:hypothetical protein